jgi:tape measure domain-containing protein
MAEIDPLIFKLIADTKAAQAEARRTSVVMGQSFNRVERDVLRLENQMKRSSAAIGGQLRGLAGTLGALFTGRELVGMIDSFTRLQNSLRVAGLEGANLERVQARLLDLSSRYGVGIEGLANLYGKASDAGRSFGASEAEVLQLTEATSQALKITGTSAAQAQGAILGLSQALASGTVRAEEFNQINEGGLRPLLQAAAGAERFGGDINKLRAAMLDGKVTSQEFFAGILAGAAELDAKASKATLTLSGAFEALSSGLTVYIGQSAEASGVTAALAGALQLLAENLDVIIPALAVIAAAMGTSVVVSAIAGSRALFALTAAMGGAATAAEALAFALGTALTGPVAIAAAITAVGGALIYMISQSDNAVMSLKDLEAANANNADELDKMIGRLKAAGVNTDELGNAAGRTKGKIDDLADSYRQALIEARKLSNETPGGKVQTLNDDILASQGRQATLAEYIRAQRAANPGAIRDGRKGPQLIQAEDKLAGERRLEAGLREKINVRIKGIETGVDVDNDARAPSSSTGTKPKPTRTRAAAGSSGPSQAEKDARAADEESALRIEQLRAQERLTDDVYERSNLQQQILAEERAQREIDIQRKVASKALTEAQAAEQRKLLDALYGQRITEDGSTDIIVQKQKSLYGQAIAREEQERIARQQTDAMRDELDALGAESGITDVRKARVELERRMLEIQQEIERKLLDEAIARGDVADAAAARSRLGRKQAADRTGFERDNMGPLGQYVEDLRKAGLNLDDQFESIAVDGLRSLNDGLADAIVNSENLGAVFKNVAKSIIADLIRIAIQQQIVNALQSSFGGGGFLSGLFGGGGGGSSLGGGLSGVSGRASGGYVAPGQMVRVNEHRGGFEGFRPTGSGDIIPLGQMNAMASRPSAQGGGTVRIIVEEGPNFMSTIRTEATGVSLEVTRAVYPSMVEGAAQETQRRLSRPRMPGAGR